MQAGRLEEAFEVALHVLAVDSKDSFRDLPKAKRVVGTLLSLLPRDQSLPVLNRIAAELKSTPYASGLQFSLGDEFDHLGERELAMGHYRQGLSLDPSFARGYLRLGEDLEDYCHDYDGAIEMYRRAFQLKKEDQEIRSRLYSLSLRLANRPNDLAWQLRDAIVNLLHPGRLSSADASIPLAN